MTKNKKSMQKLANLKVGIVVLIGLIIFIVLITVVGSGNYLFSKTYKLKMFIPDAEGLAEGSYVSLGGIKAGSVKKLEIASMDGKNGVIVTFVLEKDVENMITDKSAGSIKSLGVLGDKYIDITIGQPTDKPLTEGEYLKLGESFSLEKALNGFGGKIDSVFAEVNNTIIEYKAVAQKINEGEGTIGSLITSKDLYNSAERLVTRFDDVSKAIQQKNGTVGELIYDKTLYDNINVTVNNLKDILAMVNSGKGTAGKFVKDEKFYNNLESISDKLDSLMSKVNGNSSIGELINNDEMYLELIKLVKQANNLILEFKTNPKKFINFSVF